MSLVEKALSMITNKKTITSPIFRKEFKKENSQLQDLIELSNKVIGKKKELIERDINQLKQGLAGEENVYFELKNSFIPMLCLHDIRLEYDDYVAQFDFIVITNKFIFVLETKKLNGDIEITEDGDFIRIIRTASGKFLRKEGMYSPISQNERHVNILKDILTKEGLIKTCPIKSLVVLANPKTIINKSKCPKTIQNNIYKYDQITNILKNELNDKNNYTNIHEKCLSDISDFLIANNKPITFDYNAKYSLTDADFNGSLPDDTFQAQAREVQSTPKITEQTKQIEQIQNESAATVATTIVNAVNNKNNDDNSTDKTSDNDSKTYELLKKYRLDISKQENLKAYMVFNNEVLDSLVKIKPKSKEELLKIKGFGEKKVEKYGDEIIKIINR